MPRPYDITIFSTTGDPSGIRHVLKSNWSGLGVVFPRERFTELTSDSCLDQAGIYVLVDDAAEETVYIGEADPVGRRLREHVATRPNWSWCVYFVEKHGFIGKTEIKSIESDLIDIATRYGQSGVENRNSQSQPSMAPVNRARAKAFLEDMLLILPLLGIKAFTKPRGHSPETDEEQTPPHSARDDESFDTIVVPAREEGFRRRFLGDNCWFAIRINKRHISRIKYIAAYQVAPVGAITHLAEVLSIKPFENTGKYKLLFKAPAVPIGPIPRGGSSISMQSSRYALRSKLLEADTLDAVWG